MNTEQIEKIIEIVADVNFQLKKMGSKIRIVWTLPTNQGADMNITYACLWFFEQPEDRIPPVAKMFLMTLISEMSSKDVLDTMSKGLLI